MNRRRGRTVLLVLAVVLALGGISALGIALVGQHPAPPVAADIPGTSAATPSAQQPTSEPAGSASSPTSPAPGSASPSTTATKKARPAELGESLPTRIRIPSIKVDAEVIDVGLKPDGEMATPDADPDQAGWFDGAHTPGAPGTSIVVGHVTWNREPTVFFRLGDLRKGDRIVVDRKDGSQATFAVDRRSTFPKDAFPVDQIFAAAKDPELTLITCGGRYDYSTHSYGSNVIVWTTLVSTRPA